MTLCSVAPFFLAFCLLPRSFSTASTVGNQRTLQLNRKWTQLGNDIDGVATNDWLGYSVAISGDGKTIVAGAPIYSKKSGSDNRTPSVIYDCGSNELVSENGNLYNDDRSGTASTSGYAQVFGYSNGSWNQLGDDIKIDGNIDWFGRSVSMSEDGRAIAVGVPLYSPQRYGSRLGHVRVFEYSRGYWNQLGDDIDGKVTDAHFGYSVAMSGDGRTLVAGEPLNGKNNRNRSYSGQARVFEFSSGSWKQLGTDISGETAGDNFGASVAMSEDGSTIVVGGPLNDRNGIASGHVRVFEYVSGTWNQLGDTIDGEAAGDNFGSSVAISKDGKTIVGGGHSPERNGRDSGHARVFEYSSETWNQLGNVIDGDAAGDMFGASVSMSGDGRTIAAAAVQESGNGAGIGYARVFEYSSEVWNQVGNDIEGEGANDMFGTSVAMSEDGRTIVAGALKRDDGDNAGQVRVFTRPTDIELGKSSGFTGAITVGVLILFAGAAYFVWKRTLKLRTKSNHGATELVPIKGEGGFFDVVASIVPISLAVPVDGHDID